MPLYHYKCYYCRKEWEEELPEKQKLEPTAITQPLECDIFIAPHSGIAQCNVKLIEKETL